MNDLQIQVEKFCIMGSEFEVLVYNSNIRWLSWGKVLNRVEPYVWNQPYFLQEQKYFHAYCFKNSQFILVLASMPDIFDALNHLNQQMQRVGVNINEAEKTLKTFQKKIP